MSPSPITRSFTRTDDCVKVFLEQDILLSVRFVFDVSAFLLLWSPETVSLIFQRDKLFWCALISPGVFECINPLSLLYNHSVISHYCPRAYTIRTPSLLLHSPMHPSRPHFPLCILPFVDFPYP